MDDSQHLLLEYFDTIHNSPSQIYHSALPFSPSSSWLCTYYSAELIQKVKVVKGLPAEWGECFRTVRLTASPWAFVCWKDMIAAGCHTGDITILDGVIGSQTAVLSGHTQGVRCLTFSSDGKSLVSGSDDTTIMLWDVQTGGVIKTFCGHTGWVCSVSISADYTTIASGSDDRTIRLWDILTGVCSHIMEQQGQVQCIAFSPVDPQHFISASGGEVQQWGIDGQQINPTCGGTYVAFSLDGTQFIACQGATIMIQNTGSGAIVTKLQIASGDSCCCCFFSPNGRLVAVAAKCIVYVWDITSSDPNPIEIFVGHTRQINTLIFSSTSSLISSSHERSVKFWQIGTQSPVVVHPQSTPLASAPIKSITLQDGAAVSSDLDGVVKIWDISTGLCKTYFETPAKNPVLSDICLIDTRLIFVWYADQKIHIWDVEQEKLIQMVDMTWSDIQDIRTSGDGSKIFCLHSDYVGAWSVSTGESICKMELKDTGGTKSFIMDGSKVWVYSHIWEPQGWDFGAPGMSPIPLVTMASFHFSDSIIWDVGLSRIMDIITKKVVFQLGGRFLKPTDVQVDGWHFLTRYQSGEVLILDFSHVFL